MLAPLLNQAKKAFVSGHPVGIFAQVWANKTKGGLAFMEVRVIDSAACKAVQTATNVKEGPPDGRGKEIYILQPE